MAKCGIAVGQRRWVHSCSGVYENRGWASPTRKLHYVNDLGLPTQATAPAVCCVLNSPQRIYGGSVPAPRSQPGAAACSVIIKNKFQVL